MVHVDAHSRNWLSSEDNAKIALAQQKAREKVALIRLKNLSEYLKKSKAEMELLTDYTLNDFPQTKSKLRDQIMWLDSVVVNVEDLAREFETGHGR